jgi:hypothetical protein
VPPVEADNVAVISTTDLRAALERCIAVATDLDKKARGVTLWWDDVDETGVTFS